MTSLPARQPDALAERNWLVWSNEHHAFWGPNRCGYYQAIESAGRYIREEAEAICRDACPRANSTIYEGQPPEICMPAPEAVDQLLADTGNLVQAFAHHRISALKGAAHG